jgi:hypothetical protein
VPSSNSYDVAMQLIEEGYDALEKELRLIANQTASTGGEFWLWGVGGDGQDWRELLPRFMEFYREAEIEVRDD